MNIHFAFDPPSDIEQARCQVAAASDLVEHQKRRIESLRAKGVPTTRPEELLSTMCDTLRILRYNLRRLEAEAVYSEIRLAILQAMQGDGVLCPTGEAGRLVLAYPECGITEAEIAEEITRLALAKHLGISIAGDA